jgi:hypothetical protein
MLNSFPCDSTVLYNAAFTHIVVVIVPLLYMCIDDIFFLFKWFSTHRNVAIKSLESICIRRSHRTRSHDLRPSLPFIPLSSVAATLFAGTGIFRG